MASTAELIITNATVHPLAGDTSGATAIAIGDGRVLCVGTEDEAAAFGGPDTSHRDALGATVLPGFVDVHNHHLAAGITDLFEVNFAPTTTVAELLQIVSDQADRLGPDEWILGGSWGSTLVPLFSTDVTLAELDAASKGHPLALSDDSHHNRLVNSRALELAGITPATVDPVGGTIVRDVRSGRLTGLLFETAGIAVAEAVARDRVLTLRNLRDASARAVAILNSFGVTAFQDAGVSLDALRALHDLDNAGELNANVVTSMFVADPIFGSSPVGEELLDQSEQYRTRRHRPDFVKIFLDGVPPTRTAAFLEPYVPDETHGDHFHGTPVFDPAQLLHALRASSARGLGAKVHCTGDLSVRVFLDAVEALRAEGFTETRFQIAHGQFIDPADRPRLAALRVTADISPYLWFPGVIPDSIAEVLPAERAAHMHPNRDLLDRGVLVAGGSDWPVSEIPDPWVGIQGLVTRADPSGSHEGTLWPEQAISLREALEVFTINGARALGIDDVTGSLEPGKSADFILVDQDPFSVAPESVARTRVLETWFEGRLVHTAH